MGTFRFGAIRVYKRKETPPQTFRGAFSNLYQVTSQTQLSRPITLGHYTSWSADSAGHNKVWDVKAAADQLLWKHFCVDTHFSWAPPPARWVGGGPTNRWPNEQWSEFPDVILCWYREPIRQNESQEIRFNDFSALAQEVDKTSPKKLDLMTFRPWLQKSTKPVPGGLI